MSKKLLYLSTLIFLFFSFKNSENDWGFFAHSRINELAVFTLPSDLIPFYKKHIAFIKKEAIAPDKRRYASPHEAVRHYCDLDMWGKPPFHNLPRNWINALVKKTDFQIISDSGDTTYLSDNQSFMDSLESKTYRKFFMQVMDENYYEDIWTVDCDSLKSFPGFENLDCQTVFVIDSLSEHGILPWHLQMMHYRLVKAFEQRDENKILRLSADFGHYIGDAHVPLHTTSNYNGQLTNQKGIHGFWESRLPELFAEENYDFWVGTATYFSDVESFYWNMVLESHELVDSVLLIEKDLSRTFPKDQQYCMEERGASLIQTPCPAYAKAFHERMDGMVEKRMQDAIYAIGCAWYSAWIDAGSPDLSDMNFADSAEDLKEKELIEKAFRDGKIKGRGHEN